MRCARSRPAPPTWSSLLGGDATGLAGYAKVAANFNTATQKHLSPLGHGGPNGVYALVRQPADEEIRPGEIRLRPYRHRAAAMGGEQSLRGLSRAADDGGVSRRALGGRSAVALRLRAGGRGRAGDHRGAARPRAEGQAGRARARASRTASTTTTRRATGLQTGISTFADELWQEAGVRPDDIDVASIYDDYPTMVLAQAQRPRPHSRQRSRALLPRRRSASSAFR